MLVTTMISAAEMTDDEALRTSFPAVTEKLRAIQRDPQRPLASLSVLTIRNGRIVYEQQFGARYIDPAQSAHHLPADASTLYRVASVSKMVTAIGVMRLVEQHSLDLDEDVSHYLGYRVRNPHYPDSAITLRMLLSHTSSLRDDADYNFPPDMTLRRVLQGEAGSDASPWAAPDASGRDFRPGSFFSYVNLNWGVIGSVMEAVSGQRFDLLMQQLVLDPLKISGSFHPANLAPAQLAQLATLYRKQVQERWDSTGPWVAQVDDYHQQAPAARPYLLHYQPGSNATLFSPQGGLRISARGLSRIMLMLMEQGELDGIRLLQPASVRTLIAPQWRYQAGVQTNGDHYRGLFQSWALGMQVFTCTRDGARGDRMTPPLPGQPQGLTGVGHLGFAYGLQSGFIFDPVQRNGIIYITGGTGADPEQNPGLYSSMNRWEEQILGTLAETLY